MILSPKPVPTGRGTTARTAWQILEHLSWLPRDLLLKNGAVLRLRFVLSGAEIHKLHSSVELEPEKLNQIDISFLTPSSADNIHQTAHWKILGNEDDADQFFKKDEVCTTERIVTDGSNATYV
jgi:hypothetical protein